MSNGAKTTWGWILGVLALGGTVYAFDQTPQPSPVVEQLSEEASNLQPRDDNPFEERDPSTGDYDCDDFGSQGDAQDFFEDEGGPEEDWHNLDRNGDGIACESLD